jgi:hypothetical protein
MIQQGETVMRKTLRSTPGTGRIGLFAVTAVLAVAALLAAPSSAPACQNWTDYFTYYSDATHSEQVGWCEFDCYCQTYCDGTRTQYWDHSSWPGCL